MSENETVQALMPERLEELKQGITPGPYVVGHTSSEVGQDLRAWLEVFLKSGQTLFAITAPSPIEGKQRTIAVICGSEEVDVRNAYFLAAAANAAQRPSPELSEVRERLERDASEAESDADGERREIGFAEGIRYALDILSDAKGWTADEIRSDLSRPEVKAKFSAEIQEARKEQGGGR